MYLLLVWNNYTNTHVMTKLTQLHEDVLKHIIKFIIDDIDLISISFVKKSLYKMIADNNFGLIEIKIIIM